MDYGVTITKGASPWQIFQQKDGAADIEIEGKYKCIRLSQELPLEFTELSDKSVIIKARVALEETGDSVLPWQLCEEENSGRWKAVFKKVPAGGPYRIETYMEYEGWDGLSCTRGDMVHNIGVGDIYVIAGQSNAAGRAKNPVSDPPDMNVHMLRCSGKWDLATHPLNETTGSIHIQHYENHNPGHSPWLSFAKQLSRRLGYPIGLVNAAYGGSPLRWWNPDENGMLFQNMKEMLADYSIVPKGMVWCQGEAEGYENSSSSYLKRFSDFAAHLRKEFNNPDFPIITIQINRCLTDETYELDIAWGEVREAQRQAMHTIKHVYTVPSNDVAMYDFIHNSAEGNLVLGERCAKCALSEIYGYPVEWRAPEPIKAEFIDDCTIKLTLSHVYNWINPYDVAPENLPINAQDKNGLANVIKYEQHDAGIVITFDRNLEKDAKLHGCWRMNFGTAILDCMRMPMLSFYGFPIDRKGEN